MELKQFIIDVMTEIDRFTNSVEFTIGLNERGKLDTESPTKVRFTVVSKYKDRELFNADMKAMLGEE